MATVTDLRPLVLLRYRAGITGHTARTVHLAPMPLSGAEAVTALCGALLHPNQVEAVPTGQGMPCTQCLLCHLATTGTPSLPTEDPSTALEPMPRNCADTTPLTAATRYRTWGWPVTLRGDQVQLDLSDAASGDHPGAAGRARDHDPTSAALPASRVGSPRRPRAPDIPGRRALRDHAALATRRASGHRSPAAPALHDPSRVDHLDTPTPA